VLSFDGDEVFNADITLFDNATEGKNYLDMSGVDASFRLQTGCMKVIFLNRFVQDLLVCVYLCLSYLLLAKGITTCYSAAYSSQAHVQK